MYLSLFILLLVVVLLLTSHGVDHQVATGSESLMSGSKTPRSSTGESQLQKPMAMSIERTSRQRRGISNDSSQLLSELVGAVKGDGKEDLSTQVLQKQLDRAEIRAEKLEAKIERLESENAGLKDSVQDLRIMLAVANERQRVATGSG